MRRSGMAEINHQSRNALPEQQPTFCLCRAPSPRLRVVAPIPWAREKAPAGRRPGTEFLYRWFRAGITAIFWDGSAPRGTAGRSSSDRGVAPGASLGALENKPGMSFSFMGIVLATPLSIEDSPPCGEWTGGADYATPERKSRIRDSRFKIGASGTHFYCKTKANNLLKTQGSVPKSDKTKPSSDTFPPFPWAGLGRGKPRPYSRDTKGGAPGYLAIPKAAAAVRLGSSFLSWFRSMGGVETLPASCYNREARFAIPDALRTWGHAAVKNGVKKIWRRQLLERAVSGALKPRFVRSRACCPQASATWEEP